MQFYPTGIATGVKVTLRDGTTALVSGFIPNARTVSFIKLTREDGSQAKIRWQNLLKLADGTFIAGEDLIPIAAEA